MLTTLIVSVHWMNDSVNIVCITTIVALSTSSTTQEVFYWHIKAVCVGWSCFVAYVFKLQVSIIQAATMSEILF